MIKEIIIKNTNKPFGVKELSTEIGISESYLRDMWYQKFKINPGLIIETIRLDIAVKLIFEINLKIYEICGQVGYKNLITFRNAFKRRFNMTPKACRQIIKKSNKEEKNKLRKLLLNNLDDIYR
ncbi:MAG: helix-turn-helix domain-containing protein [Calditrichia bacterium]